MDMRQPHQVNLQEQIGHMTIAEGDRVEVHQPDFQTPRSLIAVKCDNEQGDEVDDRNEFSNFIVKH